MNPIDMTLIGHTTVALFALGFVMFLKTMVWKKLRKTVRRAIKASRRQRAYYAHQRQITQKHYRE
jgi:hypothetical protein